MNVARLNMSHGDHKSHKAVVDLVKEYNTLGRGNVALMLDTKGPEVRSGDLNEPIDMKAGTPPLLPAPPEKGFPSVALRLAVLNSIALAYWRWLACRLGTLPAELF